MSIRERANGVILLLRFKRYARLAQWLITFLVLGVIGFTGILWLGHNHTVTLPAPTGPYGVGRIEYDWVDETRIDPFASSAGRNRELPVWIWYPTDPSIKGEPAPYLPQPWLQARKPGNIIEAYFASLLTQDLAHVHAHAQFKVPVSSQQPRYPVLVMEPGLGLILSDYTTFAEDLASHGYIVVGSTPPYSSSVAVYQDGRVVRGRPAGNVPDNASPAEAKRILDQLITVWTGDVQFMLDRLEQINSSNGGSIFAGRLDMQSVGVFGHSFGGATAAEVCSMDARCQAGIDLDGYLYGEVVQKGLERPFMFIWSDPSASTDVKWQQASRDARAILDNLGHDGYQITIRGARHFNFSDDALFFAPVLRMQGGLGSIDGRRGLLITEAYMQAFFNKYLKHVDVPLLDGSPSPYPEVQSETR
jgi:predicted dienelactone hydrolase